MALTDAPQLKMMKRPPRNKDAKTNLSWGDKQKMEAAKHYMLLGNMELVSRLTGIPAITLKVWKKSEWWKTLMLELKEQENFELSGNLKTIVEASLKAVVDRLEHGDWVYNQKTGALDRKPVAMKDAHKVATDLMDRRKQLEKALEAPKESSPETQQDHLEILAKKFASFVRKEGSASDVVDVEIKEKEDALHEGWEERLQEGESPLQLEAGAEEESLGEDKSSPKSE